MEPKIVTREAFRVMGIPARGKPGEIDYGALWEKHFMPRHDEIRVLSTDKAYYGVSFETDEENVVDYIAGMAVGKEASVLEGMEVREIPEGNGAVFECTVDTIKETYGHIFKEWLPSSEFEYDCAAPSYEYYPPDTKSGEDPMFIHIPIKEKTVGDA